MSEARCHGVLGGILVRGDLGHFSGGKLTDNRITGT